MLDGILSIVLTIAYIAVVAYMVVKKFNTVWVFTMTGLGVILLFSIFTDYQVLGDKATGNVVLDSFVFVKNQFTSNYGGSGFNLMACTGYAMYMSYIGASTKLAYITLQPLRKIKNPYIVISLMVLIGVLLKMVIPSASGLGMLLMGILFPICTALGISRLSSAAVCMISGVFDWGPNDSSAIFAADQVVGIPIIEYFLNWQVWVGLVITIFLMIFMPIYLQNVDKKLREKDSNVEITEVENPKVPVFYAILPLLPLVLITVGSFFPFFKTDVATANIACCLVVLLLELIRRKDKRDAMNDMAFIFTKMGVCAANIVSILIGAAVFAQAVKLLNGVTVISNMLASIEGAPIITVFFMSTITFLSGLILGSGNAAWYAFGPLVPDVATTLGIGIEVISVPMQLAPAMGRTMSPVAGVTIAIAGMADVDSMELIKTTAVPCIISFIICCITGYAVTVFF